MTSFPVTLCAMCGLPILDQYVMKETSGLLHWHADCVRCAGCGDVMEQSTASYFVLRGALFCRQDFEKLCKLAVNVRSSQVLPDVDAEHVISTLNNAPIAHNAASIDCNTLTNAYSQLGQVAHLPVHPFYRHYPQTNLDFSNLVVDACCQLNDTNYETFSSVSVNFEANLTALSSSCCQLSSSGSPSLSSGAEHPAVSQSVKSDSNSVYRPTQAIRNLCVDSRYLRTAASTLASDNDDVPTRKSKPAAAEATCEKYPRLRTVLNEYQLRVLRTCYAVTSRPDQATKDKLEHMTGLSSTVIRVWFQNKRCKDKKRPSKFFVKQSL